MMDKVYFLDFQTSGYNPESSQVIEFALESSDKHISRHNYCQLMEDFTLPKRISHITGISEDHLSTGISYDELFEILKSLENKVTIIIHFASFEKKYLRDFEDIYGEKLKFDILCTHQIAKKIYPDIPSRGIKGLAGYLGYGYRELKSAKDNVDATRYIWNSLSKTLNEDFNLNSLIEIINWLNSDYKSKKQGKILYPLANEIRLKMPKKPGIYKMLNKEGEILYIGKAKNLHARVNSYFRGQKNRKGKKLELLAQVHNISTTLVRSPFESAVLEVHLIQENSPPYNKALKKGKRRLETKRLGNHRSLFLHSKTQSKLFDLLLKAINKNEFHEDMFYHDVTQDSYTDGLNLFKEKYRINETLEENNFVGLCLSIYRHISRKRFDEIINNPIEEAELENLPGTDESGENLPLDPDEVLYSLEKKLSAIGKLYYRSRFLEKLSNSRISFREKYKKDWQFFQIRGGNIDCDFTRKTPPTPLTYKETLWNIETYDRVRIVMSEMWRIQSTTGDMTMTYGKNSKHKISCFNFMWRL